MYRVAIFIDGGCLEKVLRREFGDARIDFEKLSRAITSKIHADADLLRCYYYPCLPYKSDPPTPSERARFAARQSFFDAINRLPRFSVRLGRLARRREKGHYFFEQKMVDVHLSIDLVQLSVKGKITHIARIAGDSDFVPATEVAKNESVSVGLFHRENPHNSLWDVADERVRFTADFINSILQEQSSSPRLTFWAGWV